MRVPGKVHCGAVVLAPPQRPADRFAVSNLVEDRSHGNQIAEVAGGVDGYPVLVPAAGAVPAATQNPRLKARVDPPVTFPHGPGDVVEFSMMNARERGAVLRATGTHCQVKTSSSVYFEEGGAARTIQAGVGQGTAAPQGGQFTAGQRVQHDDSRARPCRRDRPAHTAYPVTASKEGLG